jgi:hypothetical protein
VNELEKAARLLQESQGPGWTCPVCGEGYPDARNAGVPENGVIVKLFAENLTPELRAALEAVGAGIFGSEPDSE